MYFLWSFFFLILRQISLKEKTALVILLLFPSINISEADKGIN